MLACACGFLDIVKLLASKNKNILMVTSNLNETPLMIASKYSKIEVVEYLIKLGVNIDEKTENGETALYYATQNDDIAICKVLVENIRKNRLENLISEKEYNLALEKGNKIITLFFDLVLKNNIDFDKLGEYKSRLNHIEN